MIPYGRQDINQQDIKSIIRTLKSDIITRGPLIQKFESGITKIVGCRFAISINNATSGLHLSCVALGLKTGDILWTVPNSFPASSNCALYCGAKVDFVDIDPNTWNMDTKKLEEKLISAKKKNKLPKIIVSVHLAGQPTEQEKIFYLSRKYGFKIIEDASHSIGASRFKEKVGSCKWSDIAIFSFHPVKIITTGEGGMVLTNNRKIFESIKLLRNHGITREKSQLIKKSKYATWYYEQQLLGMNYWMTDFQAALGLSQLKRLKKFINKRNKIAEFYNKNLQYLPLQLPKILKNNKSSFHLYIIRLKPTPTRKKYETIFNRLIKNGIGVNLHYLPIYLHPYYKKLGFKKGYCPEAEKYSLSAISLPIYYKLNTSTQMKIIKVLKKALSH